MDYFSDEERPRQKAIQAWRDKQLAPLVTLLSERNIHPYHVTLAGLAMLAAALVVGPAAPWVTAVLVTLYCLVDGLDGPLARLTGQVSESGALFDIVADQLGVIAISAAAVHYLAVDGALAVVFSGFYLAVIVLILLARAKGMPIRPIVRIKYVFYGVFCLSLVLERDLVTVPLIFFAPYYAGMFFWLFRDVYLWLTPDPGRQNPGTGDR